jgi:DNA-binding GntR family transcriptional regulator
VTENPPDVRQPPRGQTLCWDRGRMSLMHSCFTTPRREATRQRIDLHVLVLFGTSLSPSPRARFDCASSPQRLVTLDKAKDRMYIDALCILQQEGEAISQLGPRDQLQRVSRADQVYESLRSMIVQGRLEPGSRLNQVYIATELDVSERTAREALMQLISEGLLVREPFTKVRVTELSADEIEEILRMRTLLEGWAIELAASRISQEELDRMRRLLARMKAKPSAASAPRLRAQYREFHQIAVGACRKRYLDEMVMRLFDRMLPYVMAAGSPDDLAEQVKTNREYLHRLVGALESGSGKKAREVVSAHLNGMIKALDA